MGTSAKGQGKPKKDFLQWERVEYAMLERMVPVERKLKREEKMRFVKK